LKDRYCRHIGAGQLIDKAVAVRVSVPSKALFRLDSVMMIESIVGELSE